MHREIRTKEVLDISDDGEELTYNQTRLFIFNQSTTGEGLQESDIICTINLPLVVSDAHTPCPVYICNGAICTKPFQSRLI